MMHTIGVDWGSSNFRACLIDGNGVVIDRRSCAGGVKGMERHEFEGNLFARLDGWLAQVDLILLSGMVTSRNGWVESPYAACPTPVDHLIDCAVRKQVRGKTLYFMPGVSQLEPQPDVMRGEEMQVMGLGPLPGRQLVILPGTHSKWVLLNNGVIDRFRTIMTGEIFDLLLNHSLAGRLAQSGRASDEAFQEGVKRGHDIACPISDAFGARARVLTGSMDAKDTSDYLSGLLIGNEIREAMLCLHPGSVQMTLLGDQALCYRYRQALNVLGFPGAAIESATNEMAFSILAREMQAREMTD